MVRLSKEQYEAEQEARIQSGIRRHAGLRKVSEQRTTPPTGREIRIAMLELRGEIKRNLQVSRRKAPNWDPDADRVIVGPCPFPGGRLPKDFHKPLI